MNPASIPSVAIPRSRFLQEFDHVTSFNHGDLVPIDCFEVLPGDDYTVKKAAIEIIMSQPIAPIMGNIKCKVVAMFVPMRLLWSSTEEFFGANKVSAGPNTGTYKIPTYSIYSYTLNASSLANYLGKPVVTADSTKTSFGKVSILKERGYYFCWSEWYRMQQVQSPLILNTGNSAAIGTIDGTSVHPSSPLKKVCKQYDMFTSCTTMPQYGAAVTMPLGGMAPVCITASGTFPSTKTALDISASFSSQTVDGSAVRVVAENQNSTPTVSMTGLWTDLANATAAKINDIRYAFQMQKYLERANYGTRFFEVLAVHYGVTSPDSRLQRPEYLGGKTAPIVIRTVLSQAGYAAGVGQQVGKPGASSITYIDVSGLFSKGFVEPGYVYVFLSTNHERLYSQGLMREDTKTDRFEFYSPEFANLGDQEIKNKEIMVIGDATDEGTFAYQGHWDEYRFRKNRVSGQMNPLASSSFDFWTLAEKFATRPAFSGSFVEENRDCITRCLTTGASGPDYLCDAWLQYQATRELPLYNIPGLVDHFGAL